jgi:hypothetical protein
MKISVRKSKKLRRSKKYDGISSSQSSSGRRSSRTSGRRSSRSPNRITPSEAMQLAEQISEFMKRNMTGDEDDENHINNKLMDIILPHKIYYGINNLNLEINSEGAHPDDKELKNLRYWTHAYRKYIDMPASNDDDAYSY